MIERQIMSLEQSIESLITAVNKNTNAVDDLMVVVMSLGSIETSSAPITPNDTPVEIKPKRKRRTKAEIEADKVAKEGLENVANDKAPSLVDDIPPAENVLSILDEPIEVKEPVLVGKIPTVEQVRAEASAVVDLDEGSKEKKGLAIALSLIASMGCKRISDIPEAGRQKFINACREEVRKWNLS